jgi:hypothetical protein
MLFVWKPKSGVQDMAKTSTTANGLSKMAMVREALATLGSEAKPKAIGEVVKAKHGISISPGMLSAYKSTINGSGASKSRAKIGGSGAGITIGDLEDVKALVNRIGPKGLSELVHVLAK